MLLSATLQFEGGNEAIDKSRLFCPRDPGSPKASVPKKLGANLSEHLDPCKLLVYQGLADFGCWALITPGVFQIFMFFAFPRKCV